MRRTAGRLDHFGDVEPAFRLVLRFGPSPIRGRHFALANLGADPICLYKELTPRTEANTVLREPLCGAILISQSCERRKSRAAARRRSERRCSSSASDDDGGGS